MSEESVSVVVCSDTLSSDISLMNNDKAFEHCREDIKKQKVGIPFTWCIKNIKKLDSFAPFESPRFRIDARDKEKFRMELELEPDNLQTGVTLYMNRDLENHLTKKTFVCVLSRYSATETDGKMEELVRLQVTFSHQLQTLIFDDFYVRTAGVQMDLFVIHIETIESVATRSSLPAGSSGGGASAASATLRLVEDMERLFLEAKFTDVSLCSEGRDIRAHRNILSGRSPVFNRMFQHSMQESQDGHVNVADVDFDALHRLVAYMYSSRLTEPLSYESAMALFVASDKYDVPDLRDVCAQVIGENLSVVNCVEVSIVADSHGHAGLRVASAAVLAAHHKEIWPQPDNSERLSARPDVMKALLDALSAGHDSK